MKLMLFILTVLITTNLKLQANESKNNSKTWQTLAKELFSEDKVKIEQAKVNLLSIESLNDKLSETLKSKNIEEQELAIRVVTFLKINNLYKNLIPLCSLENFNACLATTSLIDKKNEKEIISYFSKQIDSILLSKSSSYKMSLLEIAKSLKIDIKKEALVSMLNDSNLDFRISVLKYFYEINKSNEEKLNFTLQALTLSPFQLRLIAIEFLSDKSIYTSEKNIILVKDALTRIEKTEQNPEVLPKIRSVINMLINIK